MDEYTVYDALGVCIWTEDTGWEGGQVVTNNHKTTAKRNFLKKILKKVV